MERTSRLDGTVVHHAYFKAAVAAINDAIDYAEAGGRVYSIPLVGNAGAGKTWVLEAIAKSRPRERLPEGLKVPILTLRVPSTISVKQVAIAFLRALGDPKAERGSEVVLTDRLVRMLRAAGTVAILLDEFQHLVERSTGKFQYRVADWLKSLADETGVVLVACGLPRGVQVIQANEQLRRRFLAPVVMPRMDWRYKFARGQFLGLTRVFAQKLDEPGLENDGVAFRLYCATGGVVNHLATLLMSADWIAHKKGVRKITTPKILSEAYSRSFFRGSRPAVDDPFDPKVDLEPTTELLARISKSMIEPDDPYSDFDNGANLDDDLFMEMRRGLMGQFHITSGKGRNK